MQKARAEQTRLALIDTAARLFGEKGYHATSLPELVAGASVTRGALYHHFVNKEDLFEAVFTRALRQVNEEARASVVHLRGQTWAQFTGALEAYLKLLAQRSDFRRIILIDGLAVLGWSRWHALQTQWVQNGIVDTLIKLDEEGSLAPAAAQPLAILIQGAVNDAALAIAHSADPVGAMTGLNEAVTVLLDGLRIETRVD